MAANRNALASGIKIGLGRNGILVIAQVIPDLKLLKYKLLIEMINGTKQVILN